MLCPVHVHERELAAPFALVVGEAFALVHRFTAPEATTVHRFTWSTKQIGRRMRLHPEATVINRNNSTQRLSGGN